MNKLNGLEQFAVAYCTAALMVFGHAFQTLKIDKAWEEQNFSSRFLASTACAGFWPLYLSVKGWEIIFKEKV
jgi:hypothetical protein